MKDILGEAGITVTPSNKNQIDQAFHQIAGVTYKDCPAAWRRLKQDLTSDEQKRREIIRKLQAAIH
jgi:hypothetical protein